MQVADVEMVRAIRRELARYPIDTSETIVSCNHGVIHLNGRVRPVRGHEDEFNTEVHTIQKVLRQRQGIREVIVEWTLPDGTTPGAEVKKRNLT